MFFQVTFPEVFRRPSRAILKRGTFPKVFRRTSGAVLKRATFPEIFRTHSRAVLKRAEPRTLLCRPWAERFNIPGFK